MEPDYHTMTTDLLNSGMGDSGRLRFILECIAKNKPLYRTDRIFLESLSKTLELKIQKLENKTQKTSKQKKITKTSRKNTTTTAKKESKTEKVATTTTTAKKESKTKKVAEETVTEPKTTKKIIDDVDTGRDDKSRTLISDEYLDKHIDQIDDKRKPRKVPPEEPVRERKKSFLGRLFSR